MRQSMTPAKLPGTSILLVANPSCCVLLGAVCQHIRKDRIFTEDFICAQCHAPRNPADRVCADICRNLARRAEERQKTQLSQAPEMLQEGWEFSFSCNDYLPLSMIVPHFVSCSSLESLSFFLAAKEAKPAPAPINIIPSQ